MWPWSGAPKGKKPQKVVPVCTDFMMYFYVWLLVDGHGRVMEKPVPVGGRWTCYGRHEAEDRVMDAVGGGQFKLRFYDSRDAKAFMGVHEFTAGGPTYHDLSIADRWSDPKTKRRRA